jgi:phosphopantetheine adenylyltransferase
LIQNTYGPLLLGRIWPINTVFLEGDPRYRSVSSTVVRDLCGRIKKNDRNDDSEVDKSLEELKRLVPETVVGRIVEVYGKCNH